MRGRPKRGLRAAQVSALGSGWLAMPTPDMNTMGGEGADLVGTTRSRGTRSVLDAYGYPTGSDGQGVQYQLRSRPLLYLK